MLAYQNQRLYPSMPVAGFDKRVYCEGGSTAVINGMRYHVFTSTGTLTVVRGGVVYAMVVAAGGSCRPLTTIATGLGAGGGGGGGLLNYLPVVVPEGSLQTVTVGQAVYRSRGGNSVLTCLRDATAIGGGTSGHNVNDGLQDGGSGGGRNWRGSQSGCVIGLGTSGQGNNGGAASEDNPGPGAGAYLAGGGGGFSGAAGTTDYVGSLRQQDGGQGLSLDSDTLSLGSLISNNTHFSSGGGGHGYTGVGGSNGRGGTGAGRGAYNYEPSNSATNATMYGCGSGGGGSSSDGPTVMGFQGIVIIRYPIN